MFSIIKENLSNHIHNEDTSKVMGYPELGWFGSAVEEFGRYSTLRAWLESGYEDQYNNALRLYVKALKYFVFDWGEVENELKGCKELLNSEEIIYKSMYAETQIIPRYAYSRVDSLGMAQIKHYRAMNARKRKWIDLEAYKERFENKTLSEMLGECGVIAREHYKANGGKLEQCGEILGYRVEILGKVCRFDVEGRFVRFLRKRLWEEERGDLFVRVREKVQNTSHNDTAEKMGYTEFWRFKKGAEILGSCESLEEWIGRGFYTLGMRASEFFVGLADVFFDEKEEAEELVKKCRNISRRCEKFDGLIFVITQKRAKDFVECTSDYGVGILNEMRQIHLDRREFRAKTREDIIKNLGKKIKSHYVRNDGELGFWGKINGYKIKMYEKIFEFDTQGELVQEVELAEKRREKVKGLTQIVKEKQEN